jgi:SAM-dependent methyltransferase
VKRPLAEAIPKYVTPKEATRGPHGLFRYPAKYLPQIAGVVLDRVARPGDRVLDPFAGSGTTLVEASARGIRSLGLDLNPLAVLVSRVKGAAIEPDRLRAAAREVLRAARSRRGKPRIPRFKNRDYWFPEQSLVPLSRLRTAIEEVGCGPLHDSLLVVLLSIVKRCSNASSFQHKLTRSREPDPVTGEDVYRLFRTRAEKAADRFADAVPSAPVRLLHGDARALPLADESFDAVVTHPPYSISFDFVRSFKIYLWWLDPDRDTVALDRRMVGNQRRFTGEPPRLSIPELDERVDRVLERSRRDGLAVAWFFKDMETVLAECRRVLRPGGALALYIGDSRAQWVPLRAPDAMAALAGRLGLEEKERIPREVPGRVAYGNRQIFVEELQLYRK